jgi:hypothetical protein
VFQTSAGCRSRQVYNFYGHNGTIYDCRGLGLNLVPCDLPDDTVAIDLYDNNITHISGEDFPESDILLQISLGHNNITYIPRNTFLGLPNLRYLDVSHNDLKGFDNGTLNHLRFLKVLKLDGTFLSCTKQTMMEYGQIHSLEVLHISVSGFLLFPGNFVNMKNLTDISIDSNSHISYNSSSFVSLSTVPVTYFGISLSTYTSCNNMDENMLSPFNFLQYFSIGRYCTLRSILKVLKCFEKRTMQSLDF